MSQKAIPHIHSFSSEFGEVERTPYSIENADQICQKFDLDYDFSSLGCKTFRQMVNDTRPYIYRAIAKTLSESHVPIEDIDAVIFSTTDANINDINEEMAASVLNKFNFTQCIPLFVSMQQCATSMAALDIACHWVSSGRARHIVVVSIDYVIDDLERITPFALFSDAACAFMVSDKADHAFRYLRYSVGIDSLGIQGNADFNSRTEVAKRTLNQVLSDSNYHIGDVEKFFSTNLYRPLATFNASMIGVRKDVLYIDTLAKIAHCGNCDWMINLMDYQDNFGVKENVPYLIHSSAPGFFSCALLKYV